MSQPTPSPDPEIDAILEDPAAQAWFEEHLAELRQDAYGQRILYWILAAAFVIGLVAYVAGYLLRSTSPTEPVGLWPTWSTRSGLRSGPQPSWWC